MRIGLGMDLRTRPIAASSNGLETGLVVFFPLDEASGNPRVDTEEGLSAAETGGAIGTTTGLMYPLAAVLQAGVARKLATSDSSLFYTGSDWTLAFWAKVVTKPPLPTGAYDVLTVTDAAGANEIAFTFFNQTADKYVYGYQYNATEYIEWRDPSAGDMDWDALVASGWNLYVVTYDGANMTYSRNAGTRQTFANASANFAVADAGLTIGNKYANPVRHPDVAYQGVAWWSRALSEADVTALYNGGQGLTRAEMT